MMKTIVKTVLAIAILIQVPVGVLARSTEEIKATLAELDARCEAAREAKLGPERAEYIEECVEKGKERDYCTRFYADHGARAGNRAPLYLDLPECMEAFEYRRDNPYR
jgi:uncharacterized protein YgiB involved in biofilm formation